MSGSDAGSFLSIFENTFLLNTSGGCFYQFQSPWIHKVSDANELLTLLLISVFLVLVSIFFFFFFFRLLFSASTSFPLHSNGFFNIRYIILFWQRRIETSLCLNQPISFCANLYRNNHGETSVLLSLGSIGLTKVEI